MLDFLWSDITRFLQNPIHIFIVATALVLSVTVLLVSSIADLNVKKRATLLYAHVFFLLFPIVYFLFSVTCTYLFAHCGRQEFVFYISMLSGITATVAGLVFAPIIFVKWYKRQATQVGEAKHPLTAFIAKQSAKMKMEERGAIKLYILKFAKPAAFSYSFLTSKIFISIGMMDILTRKELEAVLLHELYHIKHKSSLLKHASSVLRMFSPIAAFTFTVSQQELSREESSADQFAMRVQGTDKHITSAKRKCEEFFKWQNR